MAKISQSNALEEIQKMMLKQAISEEIVTDDNIVIDATHLEARDQAPAKQETENLAPKNVVGNPSKSVKPGSIKSKWKKNKKQSMKKRLQLN